MQSTLVTVPKHYAMQTFATESGGKAPCILNLHITWELSGSRSAR